MPNDRRGFTLIEVLVALALIMLPLAGACFLARATLQAAVAGDNLSYAAFLAHAKLSELEAGEAIQPGWHADPANPIQSAGQRFARFWQVVQRPDGQALGVHVAWIEPGRAQTFAPAGAQDLAAGPHLLIEGFVARE